MEREPKKAKVTEDGQLQCSDCESIISRSNFCHHCGVPIDWNNVHDDIFIVDEGRIHERIRQETGKLSED